MIDQPQEVKQKDDTLTGLVVVSAVIGLLIGFMYLLSIQEKSGDCEPTYNPDGTVAVGCGPMNGGITPTPAAGSIPLLDQLNKDTTSEVDKKLQEAAEDLQRQQRTPPTQPPQQPQVPPQGFQ